MAARSKKTGKTRREHKPALNGAARGVPLRSLTEQALDD